MPAGTRAQVYKRDSSGVAPASPQVAYRALLERCIGRPPKKVGRIFGPRQGAPRHSRTFRSTTAAAMPALSAAIVPQRSADESGAFAGDAASLSWLAAGRLRLVR